MVKIQYQKIISTQPQPRINRWFVLNLGKFRLGITKPLMPCLPENYKYDFNWSCICKPQTCINLFRHSTSKTVLTILKQTFKLFKFPQHWDIFFNCKVRKKNLHMVQKQEANPVSTYENFNSLYTEFIMYHAIVGKWYKTVSQ